jgi:hypothetical protein
MRRFFGAMALMLLSHRRIFRWVSALAEHTGEEQGTVNCDPAVTEVQSIGSQS